MNRLVMLVLATGTFTVPPIVGVPRPRSTEQDANVHLQPASWMCVNDYPGDYCGHALPTKFGHYDRTDCIRFTLDAVEEAELSDGGATVVSYDTTGNYRLEGVPTSALDAGFLGGAFFLAGNVQAPMVVYEYSGGSWVQYIAADTWGDTNGFSLEAWIMLPDIIGDPTPGNAISAWAFGTHVPGTPPDLCSITSLDTNADNRIFTTYKTGCGYTTGLGTNPENIPMGIWVHMASSFTKDNEDVCGENGNHVDNNSCHNLLMGSWVDDGGTAGIASFPVSPYGTILQSHAAAGVYGGLSVRGLALDDFQICPLSNTVESANRNFLRGEGMGQ